MMAKIRRLFGCAEKDSEDLSAAIENQRRAVDGANKVTRDRELTIARSIMRDAAVTLDIVNRAAEARRDHR